MYFRFIKSFFLLTHIDCLNKKILNLFDHFSVELVMKVLTTLEVRISDLYQPYTSLGVVRNLQATLFAQGIVVFVLTRPYHWSWRRSLSISDKIGGLLDEPNTGSIDWNLTLSHDLEELVFGGQQRSWDIAMFITSNYHEVATTVIT